MPSIVDEFVAQFRLDSSKVDSGAKDVATKLKWLQEQAKKEVGGTEKAFGDLDTVLSGVTNRLLGITAIFLGGAGITQFTEKVARLTNEMSRLGQQSGESIGGLFASGAAGSVLGANSAAVRSGVNAFGQALYENRIRPNGALISSLSYMGVNMAQATRRDGTIDVDNVMMQMAQFGDRMRASGKSNADVAAVFRQVPGMNSDLITLLLQGGDKVKSLTDEMRKLAPTPEQVAAVNRMVSAWGKMEAAAISLGNALIEKIEPAVDKILDLATRLFNAAHTDPHSPEAEKQAQDLHNDLRRRFGAPTGAMKSLGDWLSTPGDPKYDNFGVFGGSGKSGASSAAPPAGAGAPPPRLGSSVGSPGVADSIAARLRANGFSDDAVAAIMGNVQQESGFKNSANKPTWDVHQYSSGFFQFGPGQRAEYNAWLAANHPGANGNDPGLQADFVAYQLKNRPEYRRTYNALTNPNLSLAQKTYEFQGGAGFGYERPAAWAANTRGRVAAAQQWRQRLSASGSAPANWSDAAGDIPYLGVTPGAMAAARGGASTSTSTSTTQVGEVHVHANTDDPYQHGMIVRDALRFADPVAQATTGPE